MSEKDKDDKVTPPEPKDDKSKDSVQARIDSEVARRHKAEELLAQKDKEIEAFKAQQETVKTKTLEEQKKYQELYEGVKAKASLADELSAVVGNILKENMEGLTDDQKALVPEGPPHKQLDWVAKARKAGIFGKSPAPEKTFDGKLRNGVPPEKWYLDMDSKDPRFTTLTPMQYTEWKQHKGKQPEPANLTGRGGF